MNNNNNLKFPLIAIVAMNQNRIIGDGNKLLWHLPGDLKRLKSLTIGTPLIMGRKTWDSIPTKFKPLKDRINIILTKNIEKYESETSTMNNVFVCKNIPNCIYLLESIKNVNKV